MSYKIELIQSADDAGQLAEIEQECFEHPLEEKQILSLLGDGRTLFLAAREGELLTGSVREYGSDEERCARVQENWPAYARVFDDYHEKQKKNHWELNELNVRKLFRYCTTSRESASTVRSEDEGSVLVRLLGDEKPAKYRFKDVALSAERIYSEQVGEILGFMLGQLEMFHLRGENRSQRTYPVTYPVDRIRVRRDAYGEKIQWTDSETTVCQLLYL